MSEDAPSSRKEKKAQRDAERALKGKKRKHAETVEDAEEVSQKGGLEKHIIPLTAQDGAAVEDAAVVKAPKSKKRKHGDEAVGRDAAPGAQAQAGEDAATKRKKRKKTRSTTGKEEGQDDATESTKSTKSRFIVFVGNLPYDTTDASLKAHFKKLLPFTLRHRTDPKTEKSKGFAFLEFENYDRMKTCLKLYHHSMFDPEEYREEIADGGAKVQSKGKKKGARRINVELTAGGGGKGDARKQKLTEKNVRLEEQRKRRAEAEMKEKAAAERKGGKEDKQKSGKGGKKEADEGESAKSHTEGMHPSRLARLNG